MRACVSVCACLCVCVVTVLLVLCVKPVFKCLDATFLLTICPVTSEHMSRQAYLSSKCIHMYTYCPGKHLSYIAMPEHSKLTSWLDFLSVNTLSANLLLLFCNSTMSINFSTRDDISLLPSNIIQFSKGIVLYYRKRRKIVTQVLVEC